MKHESISAICERVLTFGLVLALAIVATPRTQAQTFNVLYNFTNATDGSGPVAGLTVDNQGNLYGTAQVGGVGYGTAFELQRSSSSWTFVPLYSFQSGTDGAAPMARLIFGAKGRLYGTTTQGGAGYGTVFKLIGLASVKAPATETVLYSFMGGTDGAQPSAGDLILDKAGNIYGTTTYGGASGNGTVYKLTAPRKRNAKWTESVVYAFGQGTDGANPVAGVTFDAAGNLYGTTSAGGAYGYGIVFELTPSGSGWTESILYNFTGGNDGGTAYGGVIFDQSGNLYGAAISGGTGTGGTVFEMTPSSSGWTYNVLYNIPGWTVSGPFRTIMMDASGTLYVTTHCDGSYGEGSAFKLTPSNGTWTYSDLYDFTGGSDGKFVISDLTFDTNGNLYGTTQQGGANGYGVIFEVTP
jgi:uncharacterized repeat protein (TIGR03803 family)